MTEVAGLARQVLSDPLLEIQWMLFSTFGYDCYQKKWYQKVCSEYGHKIELEYDYVKEDVEYHCERCGKKRI
mgnify:CR=1 FL=1|jgi:hypothetical protein